MTVDLEAEFKRRVSALREALERVDGPLSELRHQLRERICSMKRHDLKHAFELTPLYSGLLSIEGYVGSALLDFRNFPCTDTAKRRRVPGSRYGTCLAVIGCGALKDQLYYVYHSLKSDPSTGDIECTVLKEVADILASETSYLPNLTLPTAGRKRR